MDIGKERGVERIFDYSKREGVAFHPGMHQHDKLPYSKLLYFSMVRTSKETILKSVRIMLLWPCSQRPG